MSDELNPPPINRGTDSLSRRVYALIFNGLTAGLGERFIPLSERERITETVYEQLRTGGVEVRLADGLEHLRQVAASLEECGAPTKTGPCVLRRGHPVGPWLPGETGHIAATPAVTS